MPLRCGAAFDSGGAACRIAKTIDSFDQGVGIKNGDGLSRLVVELEEAQDQGLLGARLRGDETARGGADHRVDPIDRNEQMVVMKAGNLVGDIVKKADPVFAQG